ncbi:hypothetical protein G9A89_004833 [Geosiphon pyriformis]|nr:hypothetical protein G9A89_004833 [Geosiphon pyriformis]
MSKKKASKDAFYGPAGGFFSQKKKVVLSNIKHSGNERDISLSKFGPSNNIYSDVKSLSDDNKDINISGVNNDFSNFYMDDDEVVLSFHLPISLEKKCDPKIIKTSIEVLVKKLFALDINLLAVKKKSTMVKTQLIREIFSLVNSFGRTTTPSKFEGIIRSIFTLEKSMEMAVLLARKKEININSNLKRQEMRSDQTVSFLIGKDSVHIAKAVRDCKIWASKNWFNILLFTLPIGTTAHDLRILLKEAKTGNRICCAVVGFDSNNNLKSVFYMEPILGAVSTSRPLKPFKKVVFDKCHLQLTRLYKKKSVLIFHSTVFGGKSWAQVVLLAGSSDGFCFTPGSGSLFSNTLGLSSGFPFVLADNLSLNAFFGIVCKLSNIKLVLQAPSPSFKVSAPLIATKKDLALDIIVNNSELVLSIFFFTSSNVSTLGLNSSKVLTTKVGSLESKLVAFKASVSSVLANSLIWKITMCNVWDINIPAKQKDVTKLKDRVYLWIAGKFEGVCVFTSGLNSEYLSAGVVVVIDSSLAKHVYKVSEVSGQLLSIRLLFKNKLSVLVLGLYTGASSVVQFLQAREVNSLIAKTVNESSFIILGGDFNEDVSTIVDYNVIDISDYFDTDHQAVFVSLNSIHKQANKDCWKFDFKSANNAKWDKFKNAMAANTIMFSDNFFTSMQFLDLNKVIIDLINDLTVDLTIDLIIDLINDLINDLIIDLIFDLIINLIIDHF